MAFSLKEILHNRASSLIHHETEPGLGCTEPAAVGLCAAAAASLLDTREFDAVAVVTDRNVFKNAMGVVIPGTGGGTGIHLAAALGAVAGDPNRGLKVFEAVDAPGLEKAKKLLSESRLSVLYRDDAAGLFVQVTLRAKDRSAVATITDRHDRIVALTRDGEPVSDHPLLTLPAGDEMDEGNGMEKWLTGLGIEDMIDLLPALDGQDLEYIRRGLEMNRALADYGLFHSSGLGIGKMKASLARQGLLQEDMAFRAGLLAASGVDARMGGVGLPAMTLAGSGNQGIAAGLPILAVAERAAIKDEGDVFRAVALSYLITCYIKARVGRLSALCGSVVASGAGAAAGIAYLLGGDGEKIGGAVSNHIAGYATVICDGAKTSCALKIGYAASSAVESALFALHGTVVPATDGIMGETPEQTVENLSRVTIRGLSAMDPEILAVMLSRCR